MQMVQMKSASLTLDWFWSGRTFSIVRFLYPRSRLYVTLGRVFLVQNCGKPTGSPLSLATSPGPRICGMGINE